MALVEIARFYNSIEAGVARSRLEADGIAAFLFDMEMSTVGATARMSEVCEPLKAVLVTTTASVPSYAAWVRLSAAPDIVSVSV